MTFWAVWKSYFLGKNYCGYFLSNFVSKLDHYYSSTSGDTGNSNEMQSVGADGGRK